MSINAYAQATPLTVKCLYKHMCRQTSNLEVAMLNPPKDMAALRVWGRMPCFLKHPFPLLSPTLIFGSSVFSSSVFSKTFYCISLRNNDTPKARLWHYVLNPSFQPDYKCIRVLVLCYKIIVFICKRMQIVFKTSILCSLLFVPKESRKGKRRKPLLFAWKHFPFL